MINQDNFLAQLDVELTTENIISFATHSYQEAINQNIDDPVDEVVAYCDYIFWVHASSDKQHQERMDLIRKVLES